MAKSSKILNDFSGGLNKRKDPKDLEDSEYAESFGVNNTISGKLIPLGGLSGVNFKPSTDNAFYTSGDGTQLSSTAAIHQGNGLFSFNMDVPVVNKLASSLDHDFASATWAEGTNTTNGSGASTGHSAGVWTLTTGATADEQAGIQYNAASLNIAAGSTVHITFEISGETGHSADNRTNLFVFAGTDADTPVAGDCIFSSDGSTYALTGGTITGGCNWVSFDDVIHPNAAQISCIGKWQGAGGSNDYVTIVLKRMTDSGSASTNLQIDNFYMYVLADENGNQIRSNNIVTIAGDGGIDLHSNIMTNSYTGGVSQITEQDIVDNGMNQPSATFRSDISYSNNILTISNGTAINRWGIIHRLRKSISSLGADYDILLEGIQKIAQPLLQDTTENYYISNKFSMQRPKFILSAGQTSYQPPSTVATKDMIMTGVTYSEESVTYATSTAGTGNQGVLLEFTDKGSGTAVLDDMKKEWYTGACMLFGEEQEQGPITWETETTDLGSATHMPQVKLLVSYYPSHGVKLWDPTITGFRIWINDSAGGDPLLFVEGDFTNMTYTIHGTSHIDRRFSLAGGRPDVLGPTDQSAAIQLDTIPSIVFSELMGYSATESISAAYTTSTIIGSYKYIGNVTQNGAVWPDRVLRSLEYQFLTFPENNFIDVIAGDGDEIISLQHYAEELLVFKRNRLYIVNPDPEEESLEQEFVGVGVLYPSQICETEYGVLWINTSGLYLYDGDLTNLLVDKMPEENLNIASDRGLSLVDESAGICIGYSPEDKKAIFTYGASNQNFSVYDFKSETIHQGLGTYGTGVGETCTNFALSTAIHTNRAYLIYGSKTGSSDNDMQIYHWDDGPIASVATEGSYFWASKIMDFGNPTTRKKIYGVYITYKCAGTYVENGQTYVQPMFALNGIVYATAAAFNTAALASDAGLFDPDTSHYVGTTDDAIFQSGNNHWLNPTGGIWKTAYLKPAVSVNNIYAFQFALINKGIVPSSFEVNDITIIYREKTQK